MMWKMLKHIGKTHHKRLIATFSLVGLENLLMLIYPVFGGGGVAGANAIAEGHFGVMVADRGHGTELVPLKDVAGRTKFVPADHEWIQAARAVGTALGD